MKVVFLATCGLIASARKRVVGVCRLVRGPKLRPMRSLLIAASVLFSILIVACSDIQPLLEGVSSVTPSPVSFTCPVSEYPSPQPTFSPEVPLVSGWFGDGELWVGQVIACEGNWYAGGMKVAWYRVATPGTLLIAGRRLDGTAPPIKSDVATGYGFSGFQSTLIDFPTEGCWEVTGKVVDAARPRVAKHELRFVVKVLSEGSRPANLR